MLRNKKINIKIFLLTLLLFLGLVNNSYAIKTNTVEIDISKIEVNEDSLNYKYWDISSTGINKDNMFEITDKLNKLSENELDKLYTRYDVKGKLVDKSIILENIGSSNYYFRNKFETKDKFYETKFSILFKGYQGDMVKIENKFVIRPKDSGEVELLKVDDKGNFLQKAVFRLYKVENEEETPVPLIGSYVYNEKGRQNLDLVTDENGRIRVINLPYGKYIFREIKAPDGYEIKVKDTEFIIKDNQKVTLRVENPKIPYGGHDFLKISDDNKKSPLQGAEFVVKQYINGDYKDVYQNGKILKLVSNKEGRFGVRNLLYGEYYLFETKAP